MLKILFKSVILMLTYLKREIRHVAPSKTSYRYRRNVVSLSRVFFIISCFDNLYLQNQIDDPNAEKVEYVVIVCK